MHSVHRIPTPPDALQSERRRSIVYQLPPDAFPDERRRSIVYQLPPDAFPGDRRRSSVHPNNEFHGRLNTAFPSVSNGVHRNLHVKTLLVAVFVVILIISALILGAMLLARTTEQAAIIVVVAVFILLILSTAGAYALIQHRPTLGEGASMTSLARMAAAIEKAGGRLSKRKYHSKGRIKKTRKDNQTPAQSVEETIICRKDIRGIVCGGIVEKKQGKQRKRHRADRPISGCGGGRKTKSKKKHRDDSSLKSSRSCHSKVSRSPHSHRTNRSHGRRHSRHSISEGSKKQLVEAYLAQVTVMSNADEEVDVDERDTSASSSSKTLSLIDDVST